MPARATLDQLPSVTIPLSLLVPWQKQHYFSPARRVPYRHRAFTFWGDRALFPLVHAFLDTCAADQPRDYRYVFNLLGTELTTNAVRHSRSGAPGGTYTLHVDRRSTGLTLTCRDGGHPDIARWDIRDRSYLAPAPDGLRPDAESGRGLALVDVLATSWGDNGLPTHRNVWFHLAYDMADSAWSAA